MTVKRYITERKPTDDELKEWVADSPVVIIEEQQQITEYKPENEEQKEEVIKVGVKKQKDVYEDKKKAFSSIVMEMSLSKKDKTLDVCLGELNSQDGFSVLIGAQWLSHDGILFDSEFPEPNCIFPRSEALNVLATHISVRTTQQWYAFNVKNIVGTEHILLKKKWT